MIKLTEVVCSPGHYNSEQRKVDVRYKLRNFYVNPSFIISMNDNEKLNRIHECEPIIDELIAEARFTKLAIAAGVHGTVYHDILGDPEQHLESFLGRKI
jgi:hypothetical protein